MLDEGSGISIILIGVFVIIGVFPLIALRQVFGIGSATSQKLETI